MVLQELALGARLIEDTVCYGRQDLRCRVQHTGAAQNPITRGKERENAEKGNSIPKGRKHEEAGKCKARKIGRVRGEEMVRCCMGEAAVVSAVVKLDRL